MHIITENCKKKCSENASKRVDFSQFSYAGEGNTSSNPQKFPGGEILSWKKVCGGVGSKSSWMEVYIQYTRLLS